MSYNHEIICAGCGNFNCFSSAINFPECKTIMEIPCFYCGSTNVFIKRINSDMTQDKNRKFSSHSDYIEAIKRHRALFKSTLYDAKKAVDEG